MKVLGVVTEYNPFHNGHKYHIEKSKKITNCDTTIAVMSGHFLQRGEPALLDKWTRGEMALHSGVDLVIEIPTVYACATAEFFSYGSLKLLEATGMVTDISFGSEHGDLPLLQEIAEVLVESPKEFESYLQVSLEKGNLFPVARSEALSHYIKKHKSLKDHEVLVLERVLKSPNNILAIEYLKSLIRSKSAIKPHTIQRISAPYHDRNIRGSIASATAIREHLLHKKDRGSLTPVLPEASYKLLTSAMDEDKGPVFIRDFQDILLALLRRSSPKDLRRIFDVTEGLENRLIHGAMTSVSLEELLQKVKTKRYTYTRIQRILMHLLLNIEKKELLSYNEKGGPKYIRVLAFNDRGRVLLRRMKKESSLPVITNLKHYHPQDSLAKSMMACDLRAGSLFTLAMGNAKIKTQNQEYQNRPRYVQG